MSRLIDAIHSPHPRALMCTAICTIVCSVLGLFAFPTPAVAGEVRSGVIKSTVLGVDLRFNIYLPDGYKDSTVRYPVIYLLHGASGDEHDWTQRGSAVETLDALMRRGLIRPSIAVMPSIGPQSWFADGAV